DAERLNFQLEECGEVPWPTSTPRRPLPWGTESSGPERNALVIPHRAGGSRKLCAPDVVPCAPVHMPCCARCNENSGDEKEARGRRAAVNLSGVVFGQVGELLATNGVGVVGAVRANAEARVER